MTEISKHITYKEAIYSQTAIKLGIDNTPAAKQLEAMQYVANNVFEPARNHFNVKMYISSFFRCLKLNKKLGGTATGHPTGSCIDIDCDVYGLITNKQLFCYIYKNLDFTELIYEYPKDLNHIEKDCEWIHVMLVKGREKEKQVLITTPKHPGGRLLTKDEINKILNY